MGFAMSPQVSTYLDTPKVRGHTEDSDFVRLTNPTTLCGEGHDAFDHLVNHGFSHDRRSRPPAARVGIVNAGHGHSAGFWKSRVGRSSN